jgi:hypothetical protein
MFGMEVRLAVKKSSTSNPFDNGKKREGWGIGGHEARKQRLFAELRATGAVACKKGKNWDIQSINIPKATYIRGVIHNSQGAVS